MNTIDKVSKLLKYNIIPERISDYTGLSFEQIESFFCNDCRLTETDDCTYISIASYYDYIEYNFSYAIGTADYLADLMSKGHSNLSKMITFQYLMLHPLRTYSLLYDVIREHTRSHNEYSETIAEMIKFIANIPLEVADKFELSPISIAHILRRRYDLTLQNQNITQQEPFH